MITDLEILKKTLVSEENEAEASACDPYRKKNDFVLHLVAIARAILDQYGPKIPVSTPAALVALFLFSKIVRTCRAIRKLAILGYGIEAEILGRSALEGLINLLYISKENCEERATLYIEFEHMLAKSFSDRVIRWPDIFEEFNLADRQKEIETQFNRVKSNYPDKYFWAGKLLRQGRLREMAKEVGLQWYYDFIYWFGSNQMHANARSAMEYMDVADPVKDQIQPWSGS
jgi:hypothetical protein